MQVVNHSSYTRLTDTLWFYSTKDYVQQKDLWCYWNNTTFECHSLPYHSVDGTFIYWPLIWSDHVVLICVFGARLNITILQNVKHGEMSTVWFVMRKLLTIKAGKTCYWIVPRTTVHSFHKQFVRSQSNPIKRCFRFGNKMIRWGYKSAHSTAIRLSWYMRFRYLNAKLKRNERFTISNAS